MRANLHLHSKISDGGDWPAETAARALSLGLQHAALTDHDSFGGVREFLAAAERGGLLATAAVEIDCISSVIGYRSEILGYFPAGFYDRTERLLRGIGTERRRYARKSIERAKHHFSIPTLSFRELVDRKRAGRLELDEDSLSFNKVDLYRYFIDRQLIPDDVPYKAFKKAYLDSRILGVGPYDKLSCEEVVKTIRGDGGYAVLPHLGHEFGDSVAEAQKDLRRLRHLLDYFRSIGVQGLELYWYRNGETAELNKLFRREALERGYFLTYGSDCHGPGSGKETMADFWGEFDGFPSI